MTAINIKNHIIQKLNQINDISFLNAVKTIIDSKSDNEIFYINKDLEQTLISRKRKIDKGEFIKSEDVFKETEEWLDEK